MAQEKPVSETSVVTDPRELILRNQINSTHSMDAGNLVTYQGVNAYVTGDVKTAKFAVIALHEWWGLNQQMQQLADSFSAMDNFSVIVPDLYHGKVANDASEANHLMSGLDFHAAVKECGVWSDYILNELKIPKVGIMGFCMGGALVLACASVLSSQGKMHAGSVFYGIPDPVYFPIDKISSDCHILLNFGEKDDLKGFSDPTNLRKLTEALKEHKKPFELYVYPGCGHAFMNQKRLDAYDEQSAKLGYERTVEFFTRHLGQ